MCYFQYISNITYVFLKSIFKHLLTRNKYLIWQTSNTVVNRKCAQDVLNVVHQNIPQHVNGKLQVRARASMPTRAP